MSEESKDGDSDLSFHCPFSDYYEREQLVYQRYNNHHFNKMNEEAYFAGAFVEKNVFFDYLKGMDR